MSGSKTLVTGGAGFIGRRVVKRLLETGTEVVVLDCLDPLVHGAEAEFPAEVQGARCIRADVRDPDAWVESLEGVGVVYHLAAATGTGESMYRAQRYVDVNAGGTALFTDQVLSGIGSAVQRVVLASSRAVYGEGPYTCRTCGVVTPGARSRERLARGLWQPVCPQCSGEIFPLPQHADHPVRPTSIYGATKRSQEEILDIALGHTDVTVVSLRLQNVYGPGQSLRNPYVGVLSTFANLLLRGESLSVWEDGEESRDFLYVDDAAEAFVRAGSSEAGVVDVGTGVGTSMFEAARLLASAADMEEEARIRITGQFRVGDIRHAVADLEVISELLPGWEPRPFEEGVGLLLEWCRGQPAQASRLPGALAELESAGLFGKVGQ